MTVRMSTGKDTSPPRERNNGARAFPPPLARRARIGPGVNEQGPRGRALGGQEQGLGSVPRRGLLLLAGVPVLALQRLDDHAGADGAGRGQDAGGGAIDDGGHFLEVGPERTGGDARWLEAEAALGDRLAVPGALLAELGFLAGEMALEGHGGDSRDRAGSV